MVHRYLCNRSRGCQPCQGKSSRSIGQNRDVTIASYLTFQNPSKKTPPLKPSQGERHPSSAGQPWRIKPPPHLLAAGQASRQILRQRVAEALGATVPRHRNSGITQNPGVHICGLRCVKAQQRPLGKIIPGVRFRHYQTRWRFRLRCALKCADTLAKFHTFAAIPAFTQTLKIHVWNSSSECDYRPGKTCNILIPVLIRVALEDSNAHVRESAVDAFG
jgi:hypothetical protein